jgi:alpha-L-fucosidase
MENGKHAEQYANMWRISADLWDKWPQLLHQFAYLDKWRQNCGPGHWPDADMLPLGILQKGRQTKFSRDEQYTLMTLWSIARSPLIFGGDMTRMDDFTLSLLTNDEVIAVNQNSYANRQLFRRDGLVAWVADVPGSNDKYIALFNTRDKPAENDAGDGVKIPLNLADLELSGPCRIRALWKNADLGEFSERFAPEINWHGAGLYRVVKNAAAIRASSAKPLLLGYDLGEGYGKWVPEVASYTDIVWDCNWVINVDARAQCQSTIDAARKHGLQVVLSIGPKQNMDRFLEVGLDFVKANRDVVSAICVQNPLYRRVKSEDAAAFGARVKQALPGIQFWIMMSDGKNDQNYVIPSEVDLLVVDYLGCATPQDIQRKTEQSLLIWTKKSVGRPIVLLWDHGGKDASGLVPICQPGTFRTLADIVKSNHLAGLVFGAYSTSIVDNHTVGIQARPELVSEIKQIARDWGISNPKSTQAAGGQVKDDVGPATERTPQLAEWESLKYGMFIHFGMSTFSAEASPPSSTYAPTNLNVRQWVQVAKMAGMKYAVLTAKHVTGFCLWDSAASTYDIANGTDKTDVVAAFMQACKEEGIKPGIYYCIPDAQYDGGKFIVNGPISNTYFEVIKQHISELHTRYPGIYLQWLDVPGRLTDEQRAEIYRLVKKLNPGCLVMMNSTGGPKTFTLRQTSWPTDIFNIEKGTPGSEGYNPSQSLNGTNYYLPLEISDTLVRTKYWFYEPGAKTLTLSELQTRWQNSVGRGANLLLNVPPDRTGQIPKEYIDLLMDLKRAVFNDSGKPAAGNIPATIHSEMTGSENTSPAKPLLLGYALGDDSTKWMPEVAPYTNFAWDWNWSLNEDARPQCQRTIDAARKQGLKVALSVSNKKQIDKFLEVGLDFVKANRDVVFAIGVDEPPSFGVKSDDIAEFCAKVKRALPGIQFWIILAEQNSHRSYAIPDNVDLLVIKFFGYNNPQDLQRKARESLPIWLKKFNGRPIVLEWDFWKKNSTGFVPDCQPGTFTALADIVRSNHFAGLLFVSYGPWTSGKQNLIGIESRPELVSEVKSIAKDWGITKP